MPIPVRTDAHPHRYTRHDPGPRTPERVVVRPRTAAGPTPLLRAVGAAVRRWRRRWS